MRCDIVAKDYSRIRKPFKRKKRTHYSRGLWNVAVLFISNSKTIVCNLTWTQGLQVTVHAHLRKKLPFHTWS